VPTVADLKARRLELTQAALREVILAGDLDPWRGVVAALADEFELMDIAAAAVKQGAGKEAEAAEVEIPAAAPPKSKHPARAKASGSVRTKGGALAKLYVGGGRKLKIRPGDLVGAITGEMGIDASSIGTITVFDRHSIVAVPEGMADEIVAALSASTIKGRKIQVRRDRSSS
jgi:ATP-dependent RNA helicase DeaD